MMQIYKIISRAAIMLLMTSSISHGVILYGVGNSGNTTAQGSGGAPFESVARVRNASNPDGSGGSGVYIGNGFMLTAAHISNSELNEVTFDDQTVYSRDTSFIPVQIGNTDLKVFKLNQIPPVAAVNLYTGNAELTGTATLIGWGRGRADGEPLNTNVVQIAGGGTPLDKRWGTNDPNRSINNFTYTRGSDNFTFDALETTLGNVSGNPNDDGTGANEAAATPRDSGSGLFQEFDNVWYLTGVTALILQQNGGNVTFGDDNTWSGTTPSEYSAPLGTGDPNVFVRISSYADEINALAIPEPSSFLLLGASGMLFLSRRRRSKAS